MSGNAGPPSASRRMTTTAILRDAVDGLRASPRALYAMLAAGGVVVLCDRLRVSDPVPEATYVGVQGGRFAVEFGVLVSVLARTDTPVASLSGLTPAWLVATVGLTLLQVVAVTAAATFALAELLAASPSGAAVTRYALLLATLQLFGVHLQVSAGVGLVALPLVVVVLYATVRLVPLPGRLVLGERYATAVTRSWEATRGHGWAVFGVILVIGFANHLLASVPVAGPLGSGAMAALHAGVVAVVVERTSPDGADSA